MRKKPIIGIIGKVQPKTKYVNDLWHRIDEVDEFRYQIIKNGGIAITLLPTESVLTFNNNDISDDTVLTEEELFDLYRQIDLGDSFILQGGLVSCKYEIEMAKRIIELNKPLIGVCAGFNNILRALGTNVIENKDDSHDHYDTNFRHKIKIEKDTIIFDLLQQEEYLVNSIHSMVATKEMLENYVKISSYSEDGFIESFEVHNKKFIVGIKWHPELMNDQFMNNLFNLFIQACL